MEPIRSLANPALRALRALADDPRARRDSGEALAQGPHLCGEALAAGVVLELWATPEALQGKDAPVLLTAAGRAGLKPRLFAAGVLARLGGMPAPQGWLARVTARARPWPAAPDLCLALDGLQDPGNVGTLLRSAWAAGACVLLGPGCADPWSPKVLRAGVGASFQVPFRQVADLPAALRDLAGRGLGIQACGPRDGVSHVQARLDGPTCFVLGAEGPGLSAPVEAACTARLRIDQPGKAESLNVGVSGGILLFEALRQRLPGR